MICHPPVAVVLHGIVVPKTRNKIRENGSKVLLGKSYLYKFGGISRKEDNFAKYTENLLTETFLPRFPDFSLG